MGQAHGEAERIDLPLALVQLRLHGGEVLGPGAAGGAVVERVGVRIYEHAPGLAVDDAGQHALQLGVLLGQRQVGPDLGGGIAQPHGVDIAGDDEGVRFAIQLAGTDRGVERIGKAVLEEPRQFRIGDGLLNLQDAALHGGAGEFALRERRTLAGERDGCGQTCGLETEGGSGG